jgi:tetratricopeptide (TPR) repeat protein
MRLAWAAVVVAAVLGGGDGARARAESADETARALFVEGKAAYNRGDFQTAYDDFWRSFQLSHKPELLYNVSSALQGLHRPRDAAEALRSFLRLRPNDPDAPQIEERIRVLEEEQRLLDLQRGVQRPPTAPRATSPDVTPPRATSPDVTPPRALPAAALTATPRERPRRRVALVVGLTVGAVVVVGLAVGLGVGLSSGGASLTPSPVPPIAATQ